MISYTHVLVNFYQISLEGNSRVASVMPLNVSNIIIKIGSTFKISKLVSMSVDGL